MPPKWMPLWKMFSMWSQFFSSKMHPKWMPSVTTVLNAKPFLVSHDAPHMDAFSVKDSQHWILFVWHIAPEIDDGRCSQCQPLVLFVQELEKTLWTLKTLLTETFCMQNARLPCETKAPPNELVSCFLGWRINWPTHIQNHFQGFWLFHLALAVYPDPAKSFQNAAPAWRYGTYLGPPFKTHNR